MRCSTRDGSGPKELLTSLVMDSSIGAGCRDREADWAEQRRPQQMGPILLGVLRRRGANEETGYGRESDRI